MDENSILWIPLQRECERVYRKRMDGRGPFGGKFGQLCGLALLVRVAENVLGEETSTRQLLMKMMGIVEAAVAVCWSAFRSCKDPRSW